VRLLGGITVTVAKPAITSGGSSSVVIELDSLGAPPAPSMEQVLRAMPLIQIRTKSRGEAQPALRGSEDRQVSILVDGVPLTLGWDHRTDMSIIPLTAAQDVTLVRGLSSVLYGPNTLGGVVAVDVARSQERVGAVDPVSAGISLDQTGATNLSAAVGYLADDTDHQWVFRGGAGYSDRQGLPLAGGLKDDPDLAPEYLGDADDLRLNSDARRVDGFFTARYRADEGIWGALSLSGYDVERGVPPEAHQSDPRFWRYPVQQRVVAALSGGTGHRDTGKGTGDLEFALGFDGGSTLIESYTNENYSTVAEWEDSDDFVFTARILGEHTLGDRANVRASATYADVSHDEILTPGDAASYQQRLWSLGAESEIRFGGQGATSLSLGGALDGADTPKAGDKPEMGRISDYGLRAGMTSLVADGILVHGSVSRRSRFPSLRELYSGALGRFEPNPDLRAESLLGAEAGVTATGALGEVQIVGFHQRLTDGIVRRSVTGADGGRRFQRVNQDEVRSTGAELLAVATFGRTTLTGDLTLQDVKGLDADGTEVELEYEPALAGKLGANVPLPAELWLGGDMRYMGEQKCENPEVGGLEPLASSTVFDLTLRRLFGMRSGGALSRVEASAAVRNVADAAVFDQCGLPQAGRIFQIQLRLW
jgi:iron complex outermembrane receptor protein